MEPRFPAAAPESIPALCRITGEQLAHGQHALAARLYRKGLALALAEEIHGRDSIETARACNNLGVVSEFLPRSITTSAGWNLLADVF